MREIEKFLKSNQQYLDECKEKLKTETDESEIARLKRNIDRYQYYIMGLNDAKKYIEKEQEINNEKR